jgi:hypothetical protein
VIPLDPAAYPVNADVVFNLALFSDRIADAAKSLKPGGKMVTIMFPAATQQDLRRDDVELHFMLDMDGQYGGMPDVAEAAASGNLTAEVARVFSFEKAVEAVIAYATEKPLGKVWCRSLTMGPHEVAPFRSKTAAYCRYPTPRPHSQRQESYDAAHIRNFPARRYAGRRFLQSAPGCQGVSPLASAKQRHAASSPSSVLDRQRRALWRQSSD